MRVDDNRPSASEESARQDRDRRARQKDPAQSAQISSRATQQQVRKEAKSPFDEVLENYTRPPTPPPTETPHFEQKVRDALSDRNKSRDSNSDKKKEKDSDSKTHFSDKNQQTDSTDLSNRDRILGTKSLGERDAGGGDTHSSGGQGGSSSKEFGGRSFKQGLGEQVELSPTLGRAFDKPSAISGELKSLNNVREIPKQVLDQIVQYVRVGLNKDLNKEIQVDLSEKIFKGLSLRVSSNRGLIQVSFLTGNAEVRRLFEASKNQIAQELKQKGIQVEKIQVQFLA